MPRRLAALLCIVWICTLLVLALAAKHRAPRPDEGHFASSAYNLAHHGFTGTTTVDPAASGLLRIDQRTYWTMPLYMLLEAAWFLVFPASIFWARMLTAILLVLAAVQFYRIVLELTGDKRIASLAATLLPCDYALLYAGVSARPDVLCLLFGLTGIAAYLHTRVASLTRALVIANVWLALSALTHPNALLHLVALCVLAITYDRQRLNLRVLAASASVYVVVFALFAVWALQDFEAFRVQMLANGVNKNRVSHSLNPFFLIYNELSRYVNAYGLSSSEWLPKLKASVLPVYGVALVAGMLNSRFRLRRGVTILLCLWAGYFVTQIVFNQKLSVYLVHIVPVYSALVAALLVELWTRRRAVAAAFSGVVAASATLQPGGMLWTARSDKGNDQREVASFVQQHASNAKTINGTVVMVFALGFDPRLVEDHGLGLLTGKHPDVIITDDNYRRSFEEMAGRRPQLRARVDERLSAYIPVMRKAEYRVFFSPEFCGMQPEACPSDRAGQGERRAERLLR